MNDTRKTILFVPQHSAGMLAMLPVAESLQNENSYRPLFFLFRRGRFQPDHYDRIEQLGIEWTQPDDISYLPQPEGGRRPARSATLFLPEGLRSVWSQWIEYKHCLRDAGLILERECVCLLILMGDRQIGWETCLVERANQRGVPSLIVPFATSQPEGDALFRLQKGDDLTLYEVTGKVNRLAARLFPQWVFEHKGRRLLFYPGSNALVARALRIMPARPWSLLGGSATRAAVENKIMFDEFLEQGVDRTKMVITGHPGLDASMQALASAVPEASRDRRLIVFAVPNLAEHALLPWDQHMHAIEYTIETIRGMDEYQLLLNLHPKSERGRYLYLEDKYDVTISTDSIYTLIAACDVYMATHSSTVMQAIGLHKPTIVLDYFGTGKEVFGEAPGVVLVNITEAPETLAGAIENMLDPGFYGRMKHAQSLEADDWIIVDGRSTARVVEQIHELISMSEQRNAA